MKASGLIVAAVVLLTPARAILGQTRSEASTASVTVTGEVLRYEPRRVLVIRTEGREIAYTLEPGVSVPADIEVGRTVSVRTELDRDGGAAVTRVTTISVLPDGQVRRTTEETRVEPGGTVRRSRLTMVSGEVVRYEPGRTLVLRDATGEQTAYVLAPTLTVPAAVEVGRKVTLHTEPGPDGTAVVARVTTTALTPDGRIEQTTEETRTEPGGESTRVTTVTVQGTVEAIEPGKSLTVLRPDGAKVLYVIDGRAILPPELSVGKTVTIRALPVVETIVIEKQR